MVSAIVMTTVSHAQTQYKDSVYNYKNSPYNFENSPYNYKNSPYNFDNSRYNVYSKNATYDDLGRRNGYRTESKDGVTNYYDNQGHRKGYSTR